MKNLKKRILCSISCLILLVFEIVAQANVQVTITDEKNEPLIGAQIYIENLQKGTITNNQGTASLDISKEGSYLLKISMLGYEVQEKKIKVEKNKKTDLQIQLIPTCYSLDGITCEVNEVKQKNAQAFQISVLDIKPLQLQSKPISGLVNQISGVRVREDGGMGSEVNIMLNGIGGKGVRIFVDDVPADLLGGGMAINNLPVNMIDHIEIYKGMVPSRFGTDALGGILNLVTRNQLNDYLDITTGMGSFGTYQYSLNARKYIGANKKAYIGLNGYYNHSDNNYTMDSMNIIYDPIMKNTRKGSAKRFHDAYTSYLGKITLGMRRLPWADDLQLNIAGSYIDKEWQHGLESEIAWGEPVSKQKNFNTELRWKKSDMLNNRLDASLLAGYNYIDFCFVDTAAKTYYWDALSGIENWVSKNQVGETGYYVNGRNPVMYTNNYFTRANLLYRLVPQKHSLNLTWLMTGQKMSGHDDRGVATFGSDPLKNPQELFKNYIGLSLESNLLNKRITNILSGKNYSGKTNTNIIAETQEYEGNVENTYNDFGFGEALKIQFHRNFSSIINYEYSLRIPDSEELFGNFITTFPNSELKPERSHNIDLGFKFQSPNNKLILNLNAFYRYTSDLIFLNSLTAFESVYMNLLSTKTKGVEGEIKLIPIKNMDIYANITWQDIRLAETDPSGKIPERYVDTQVPNTPWLFGNAGINYSLPVHFFKTDKIQMYYAFNYVHDFFLTWAVDGSEDEKTTIPQQLQHNAGISYSFLKDRFSLSGECRNISDEKIYDNYSVQKPGRSFYMKLRMYLEK